MAMHTMILEPVGVLVSLVASRYITSIRFVCIYVDFDMQVSKKKRRRPIR
jgi:hypothetical protein